MYRVPTRVTASDGSKVTCVCGRHVGECKQHAMHRLNGRYCYPVAYYIRLVDATRGFTGHGLVGTSYTHDHVDSMRREDLEEMEHLTVGLEEETDNDAYPEDSNDSPRGLVSGPPALLNPKPRGRLRLHQQPLDSEMSLLGPRATDQRNLPSNYGTD
jgi:hypothetical protein